MDGPSSPVSGVSGARRESTQADESQPKVKRYKDFGKPVIFSSGKPIDCGVSGIVILSPEGFAIKEAWPHSQTGECRQDLTQEAMIYDLIGPHPRFLRIERWDPEACILTMEYFPNGDLEKYLEKHHAEITFQMRRQWLLDIAAGLCHLHSLEICYVDVKCKNLLLDADLRLKLADFSSSSYKGSEPSGCAGLRFMIGDKISHSYFEADFFAFGSTAYTILSGKPPFKELESDEVVRRHNDQKFADLQDIPYSSIISKCWHRQIKSATELLELLQQASE